MPVALSIRGPRDSTSRDITGGEARDDRFEVKPCAERPDGPAQAGAARNAAKGGTTVKNGSAARSGTAAKRDAAAARSRGGTATRDRNGRDQARAGAARNGAAARGRGR